MNSLQIESRNAEKILDSWTSTFHVLERHFDYMTHNKTDCLLGDSTAVLHHYRFM